MIKHPVKFEYAINDEVFVSCETCLGAGDKVHFRCDCSEKLYMSCDGTVNRIIHQENGQTLYELKDLVPEEPELFQKNYLNMSNVRVGNILFDSKTLSIDLKFGDKKVHKMSFPVKVGMSFFELSRSLHKAYLDIYSNETYDSIIKSFSKKYELLEDDTKMYLGYKLYRIKALKNFNQVQIGDLGGYIENESNLSHEGQCWIRNNAKAMGGAKVYEDAVMTDEAIAFGNCEIFGEAKISDRVCISGEAKVYGKCQILERASIHSLAEVYGEAKVYGNASISGSSSVYDHAYVYSYASIGGDCKIYGSARVQGTTSISGKAHIYGNAYVYEKAYVGDDARVFDTAHVYGNCKVYGSAIVCESACLKFGRCNFDIRNRSNIVKYIYCSLGVYPEGSRYLLYKKVISTSREDEFISTYSKNFTYKLGEVSKVKEYDPDPKVSCGSGIHVSTPDYWNSGEVLIQVEVYLDDIITCQSGKLRVKKCKTLRVLDRL